MSQHVTVLLYADPQHERRGAFAALAQLNEAMAVHQPQRAELHCLAPTVEVISGIAAIRAAVASDRPTPQRFLADFGGWTVAGAPAEVRLTQGANNTPWFVAFSVEGETLLDEPELALWGIARQLGAWRGAGLPFARSAIYVEGLLFRGFSERLRALLGGYVRPMASRV